MITLLPLSILGASLNSAVLHKADLTEKGAIYKFNLFGALMWCVCLFIANGGVVVLSTVVSMIIFNEKLPVKQLLGLLLGISGICIIGIL